MDEENQAPNSRRIVRRGRSGFGFSNAGLSDSTATEGGSAPEDRPLNAAVQRRATTPPETIEQNDVTGSPHEEFNPRARMQQVRTRASQYEREYRLGLLHRLLMRRVPMDEIADQLGISISQVYRDRDELREKLRAEARGLDIDEMIGDSKGFYEEAAAMSMRAASKSNLPMPMKLAAIRTGLAAKNDMHRFFQTAGVYDVLRFRLAQDGKSVSDVRRLMENTERLLAGDTFSNPPNSGDQEDLEL